MSARIVVGYTATTAGADALALGARLALATDAGIDLVVILPSDDRSVITPPDAGFDNYLREQAETWLGEAAGMIPDGVAHTGHVRFAESFAQGLVAAAAELGATHIVVGAANGGIGGRHRLGTVATELLHSSDVPVVLAPEGSRAIDATAGVGRLTAAVGTRRGAEDLLTEAVALAAAASAPLRIVSLVAVDLPEGVDTGVIRLAGASHAQDVVTRARARLPQEVDAEAIVADGENIEDAVSRVTWLPDEIVLVGSSRLAQPRRLFLGSTAAKMLHALPVPMIVVPRTDANSKEGAAS